MKVKVKSLVDGTIGVKDTDLRINRTWSKKGAVYAFEMEDLEQLMYDPGVEYMFREGILAVVGPDKEKINIQLGLQDENEPEKQFELTDDRMKEIMSMKMVDFRKAVNELTHEQQRALVDYCVEHKIRDYDRAQFLKTLTHTDIMKAIELNEQDKEEVKEA